MRGEKKRERREKRREKDWGSERMTRVPVKVRCKSVQFQVSPVLMVVYVYVYLFVDPEYSFL